MVIGAPASRHSMAVALSLAGHGLLLSLLASQAFVRLAVVPSPLVLTFVEPAARTAGPGERSPRLRVAAGQPRVVASAPRPPARPQAPPAEKAPPAAKAPPPEPAPVPRTTEKAKPARPVDEVRPQAGTPPQPQVPPASERATGAQENSPPARPADAAGAEVASLAPGVQAGSAGGADARSTAPAWAPEARVRYEELLFAWMDRYKQYPMVARRRGLEGSGAIRVRIDRQGRVVDRSIQRSTGETLLDRAALDMVRRASPFPAVPDDYAGEGFEFVAPIQYRLR